MKSGLYTWRKLHHKRYSGRHTRGIVLRGLWCKREGRYKFRSLYAVFKIEKVMKLFRLFFKTFKAAFHFFTILNQK